MTACQTIGDRWPDTLATHERLIAGRASHGEAGMSRVRHRSTQHTCTQRQRIGKPSREPLAAFALPAFDGSRVQLSCVRQTWPRSGSVTIKPLAGKTFPSTKGSGVWRSCFHSSASASQYSISFLASAARSRHINSKLANRSREFMIQPKISQLVWSPFKQRSNLNLVTRHDGFVIKAASVTYYRRRNYADAQGAGN